MSVNARLPRLSSIELAQADGTAIHAFIAYVAGKFGAAASVAQIVEASAVLHTKGLAPVYRQSIKQRVVTATSRYFTRLSPQGWQFMGSEWMVGGVALDLLWKRGSLLIADEVKTGAVALFSEEELKRQVAGQLEAGRREWGKNFLGVRAIRLREPELSDLEVAIPWR